MWSTRPSASILTVVGQHRTPYRRADLLLEIVHQRIRQAEALANAIHCLGVGATVKRDDEGRLTTFIVQPLKTLQLREARRRP